jgi:hypothetical protein
VTGEQCRERSRQGLIEKNAHRPATDPWRRAPGRPLLALASQMESDREIRRANLRRQGSRQGSSEGPSFRETRVSRPKRSGHYESESPRSPRRLCYTLKRLDGTRPRSAGCRALVRTVSSTSSAKPPRNRRWSRACSDRRIGFMKISIQYGSLTVARQCVEIDTVLEP